MDPIITSQMLSSSPMPATPDPNAPGGVTPTPAAYSTAPNASVTPAAAAPAPNGAAQYGASSYQPTTITGSAPWNVNPNQTVAGLIPKLMDPNSPIIQQAMTSSNQMMNGRGLLNSSIATGAAQDAAYRAAIPIAQADAATNARAASYNADTTNQNIKTNAGAVNQAGQFNAGAENAAGQSNAQQSNAITTTTAQLKNQMDISKMDQATRVQLQGMTDQNQLLINSNQQAGAAFQNAVSALNNIAVSTTMDATTKTQQSAEVFANLQSAMRVAQATAGLNLASILGTNPYNPNAPVINADGTPAAPAPGAAPPPAAAAAPAPYVPPYEGGA